MNLHLCYYEYSPRGKFLYRKTYNREHNPDTNRHERIFDEIHQMDHVHDHKDMSFKGAFFYLSDNLLTEQELQNISHWSTWRDLVPHRGQETEDLYISDNGYDKLEVLLDQEDQEKKIKKIDAREDMYRTGYLRIDTFDNFMKDLKYCFSRDDLKDDGYRAGLAAFLENHKNEMGYSLYNGIKKLYKI